MPSLGLLVGAVSPAWLTTLTAQDGGPRQGWRDQRERHPQGRGLDGVPSCARVSAGQAGRNGQDRARYMTTHDEGVPRWAATRSSL